MHTREQAKAFTGAWNRRKVMVENQTCFEVAFFLKKDGYSFRRFNCNRELIHGCWRKYRASTFVNIDLNLTNIIVLKTDDLKVLEVLEKCSKLTKYVGC